MNNQYVIRNESHYMLVVWEKKLYINVHTFELICFSNAECVLILTQYHKKNYAVQVKCNDTPNNFMA